MDFNSDNYVIIINVWEKVVERVGSGRFYSSVITLEMTL